MKSAADDVRLSLCADLISVLRTSMTAAGSSTKVWAAEDFFPTVTVYVSTSLSEVEEVDGVAVAEWRYSNIGSSEVSSPTISQDRVRIGLG